MGVVKKIRVFFFKLKLWLLGFSPDQEAGFLYLETIAGKVVLFKNLGWSGTVSKIVENRLPSGELFMIISVKKDRGLKEREDGLTKKLNEQIPDFPVDMRNTVIMPPPPNCTRKEPVSVGNPNDAEACFEVKI
jgi:hypothetical protein